MWDAGGRKIRDISTKPPVKPNQPPPPDNHVLAIAFSPDGKVLAAGTSLGQILLINSADGKTIRTLTGHTSSVTGLAFHPGGIVLASASKDRTVRLWNPANGQMLKSLTGHEAWVQGLVFARRGTLLASVGADRTVRLWSLEPPSQ
ncbi:MAG: hypothetical protein KatS3mg105_3892 [Gemmatales bacterium]|nr:MAG: hypothetical protein KatS3mg105_3892 [Gemmatales bacterium]